jgi:ribosome-associated protein
MPKRLLTDKSVEAAARAAMAKKAEDLQVLDIRGLSDVADYFLICHGHSGRQVQTISDGIQRALRPMKRRPSHVEGYTRGEWILMDYLDFVVHIFTEERRAYYRLERLWADAPRLAVKNERPDASASADGGDAA